ncbi:helix-turn-helix domain-containing protein [Marinobacterium sp. CAU 1594]|uniref:helix-turn-helix domain-containing protein n=1 Tax=Marinobacterium arenosum TaxID=2862496 RepID=UPI001C944CF3|nr:helix-turn-helix domain-containing protein [Marinobacterium arenosum]
MSYQQLTVGKRYQISALLAQGCSPTAIANNLGIHRSTVYRELKRNGNNGVHVPEPAQAKAPARKARSRSAHH